MSDVNAHDLARIETAEEMLPLYQGSGADMKFGTEVELAFFKKDDAGLRIMNAPENKLVMQKAHQLHPGDWVRNEPTSDTLEAGSIAADIHGLDTIIEDTYAKMKALEDAAAAHGLKRSFFQDQPGITVPALLSSLVDIPRYQAFFGPPREDMMDIAAYFAICKSTQVSVSYKNPDHMLENVRRLYVLAPFLFLLLENSSGFDGDAPASYHHGMKHRAALKDRGLFPSYLFDVQSGAEYITRHIDQVMNNPLFVYYDQTGAMVRLPSGSWTSFNELKKQGLNTATNYWFAQSILWPDVKIAALKDEAGQNVTGHRYEARIFGVGAHQPASALLITAALAADENFAAGIDGLLMQFGFDLQSPATKPLLKAAYDAARNHNGAFFDIAYGNGNMSEFAQKFGHLLAGAKSIASHAAFLAPILDICESGCTDAKINRLLFSDLATAQNWQNEYDAAMLRDPHLNNRMIFASKLERSANGDCQPRAAHA